VGQTDRINTGRPGRVDDHPTVVAQNDVDRAALDKLTAAASVDCNALYKNRKLTANQVTALEFDSCYYNSRLPDGSSRKLKTPVMKPGANGVPVPKLEEITTEGATTNSRQLDVYVHALPSVPPVYWDKGGIRHSGTGYIAGEDGLMVTNKHVIDGLGDGALQVKLMKPDGTQELRTAHVVKRDAGQDLALLQIDKNTPNETFQALPLSQVTQFGANEAFVEMGNANGMGTISMAKVNYKGLVRQSDIPFSQQPGGVIQNRSMYKLDTPEGGVPHGYSGGVVLSVPGSERDADRNIHRLGPSAVRAITDYSDLTHEAWVIPAPTVQSVINAYREEQAAARKKQ